MNLHSADNEGIRPPSPSGWLSREDIILQIKYGAEIMMARNNVIGHDDLDFLISASVNRPVDKVSELDMAEDHAVLMGLSRLKPVDRDK